VESEVKLFGTEVLAKLREAEKGLLERDTVLRQMLMVEFGIHHQNIESSVKPCKLVCNFCAPLLTTAEVDVPVKLLQIRYEMVLTQRLLGYNHNLQKKNEYLYQLINNYINNIFTKHKRLL